MKLKFTLFLSLLFLLNVSRGQMRYLQASLSGSQEVPANASTGSGIVIVKYNTATNFLLLYGDYMDLTANTSASHIHGFADPGSNAGVIVTLTNTGGTTGALTGSATLTELQETELLNGRMYVNVHNATFPGGEVRGQLIATTLETDFFNARLQGAQEVPANGSVANGVVSLLLDKTAKMVYLTGQFNGLAAAATASHIHAAPPHINGTVKINLVKSSAVSGALHVASVISDADIVSLLAGNTYVNVHNTIFPGGEIRGQLNMLSQSRFITAVLEGSQEVPANASGGKGVVIAKYNTETNLLELAGNYQNLTSNITASHIHGNALPGEVAGVLLGLAITGGTSGIISLTATLTEQQEADLFDGKMYVNVHSVTFPGGEIRGQLAATSPGQTELLSGNLQGSQEVPANISTGTGGVVAVLDKLTREVFVTGTFSGLSANASAAHIHRGEAGVAGPVAVSLSATSFTAGTVSGHGIVSEAFADSITRGFSYVNIHNGTYPGGELRAQLGNQVLPVKLTFFNAYKDRNNVNLVWESAQEINTKQYEVEQLNPSTKGWMMKKIVVAIGGNKTTRYQLSDIPLTSFDPFIFYRLKMVDKDGKFSYSPIIRINFQLSSVTLGILANQGKNAIKYQVTGLSSGKKLEIAVLDLSGRVMFKSVQPVLPINTIETGRLSVGVYKLVVRVDDLLLQQSFIK